MRTWITSTVFALSSIASIGFGAEPQLYVLRIAPDWRQGIVRLDPESGVETRFADFVYDAYFGPAHGGLRLAVLSDRIIAQGAAYYDFDAASGQWLHQYPASGPHS